MSRFLVALLILPACGGGLDLGSSADAPVAAPAESAFYADVSYGEFERNAFDIVHFPDAGSPSALLVYIHGGGFTGGNKEALWEGRSAFVEPLLEQGVAVASCNYRLLEPVDTEGVIKPMTDSMRCLQTLRYHADQLNIDPDAVVLAGTSAGAGTALWLGSHDDMAEGDEGVGSMSTRVDGVVLWETQATYDLVRWNDVFLTKYGLELFQTAEDFGLSQALFSFYGIASAEELESEAIVAYRADVDMLALIDATDAPVWVENSVESNSFPFSVGALYHHPRHALAVHVAAVDAGLAVEANIPKLDEEERPAITALTPVDFALQHLGQ